MTNIIKEKYLNKTFKSNNFGDFQVIGVYKNDNGSKSFICRFINTGYETITSSRAISNGAIKDNLIPNVFEVGYLGYADKKSNKELWTLWHSIIRRCYSKVYLETNETYQSAEVWDRWHRFEYFIKDVEEIIGYNDMISHQSTKFDIDKDILNKNKIYSIKTCCFIPQKLNKFYVYKQKTNTSGYWGVSWNQFQNSWEANISIDNIPNKLGFFDSKESAFKIYRKEKGKALEYYLNNEFDFIDENIKLACRNKLKEELYDAFTI